MDSDLQADQAWLLGVQRKLYQWSQAHPEDAYRDLWNWIPDIRNLRCAWWRGARPYAHASCARIIPASPITASRAGRFAEVMLMKPWIMPGTRIATTRLPASLSAAA